MAQNNQIMIAGLWPKCGQKHAGTDNYALETCHFWLLWIILHKKCIIRTENNPKPPKRWKTARNAPKMTQLNLPFIWFREKMFAQKRGFLKRGILAHKGPKYLKNGGNEKNGQNNTEWHKIIPKKYHYDQKYVGMDNCVMEHPKTLEICAFWPKILSQEPGTRLQGTCWAGWVPK